MMIESQCNKKTLFCCVRFLFRRFVSLVLILVLLPCCLAVPVMAEETDDVWINILDYGYANNSNSNVVALTDGQIQVSFPEPSGLNSEYLDIIFVTDSTDIRIAGGDAWFSVHSLGDGVYRAFGFHNRNRVYLDILYSTGTYIEFLSVKSLPISYSSTPLSYYGHVYDYSYSPTKTTDFSGVGSSPMTSVSISPNAGQENFTGFVSRIYLSSWNAYDYISLDIALFSSSFASLKVEMDGLSVPYEINTVESTDVLGTTLYLLDILIDTRNLDRTSTSNILVDVSGMVNPTFTGNFTVRSCLGFVSIPTPSLWSYWFSKIDAWLSGGFSSVVSSLSTLGTNIGKFIDDQTAVLSSLLETEVSKTDSIRWFMSQFYIYLPTWISDQTSAIVNSLSAVDDSINIFSVNVGTWITNLSSNVTTAISNMHYDMIVYGQSITNSITSAADRIVDAITGGENADDLQNGANQIGEAGSSLGSNIGSIQDFEDQYFGQLDSNLGTIISGGNLSGIVAPLAFVQRYTNLIVGGIPSNYMVIFTLPIMLGIFFYIVRHPIKAPRPGNSGESVTREVGGKDNE